MSAELKGIDEVRRSRRAAIRAVQHVDAGGLAEQEVDFCRMLFGEAGAEEKLAASGLLDDGGLCDDLVDRTATWLFADFETLAPVQALTKLIEGKLIELQRSRAEMAERGDDLHGNLSRKVASPKRRDVAERNARTRRIANARLLAVHLAQRAFYEGMGRAFAEMVRQQVSGHLHKEFSHGPIAMGEKHVAAADVALSRMRKSYRAGAAPRRSGNWAVISAERPIVRIFAETAE